MSSQFGFIDIILLAMFAGFIILRLRNILGRKTGYQGKSINRYFPKGMEVLKDINNNEAIREGNVDEEVKKPNRTTSLSTSKERYSKAATVCIAPKQIQRYQPEVSSQHKG